MMWASSALLAAISSFPGGALGFVVPIPVASLSGRTAVAPTPAAHVALDARRRGAGLSMQGSAAGQAGESDDESAAATAEGVPWAEQRFPGCSTVLSTVGFVYFRVSERERQIEGETLDVWARTPAVGYRLNCSSRCVVCGTKDILHLCQ